ncbi:XTP/dITP diphosphohydrolase [Motilibacter rhizosphaerae]|uniref:XTP/dITP diphosphohydrolase n=1 Tax=Motilibacter rhizosphaerae TaxID=598652 RepID=A0A4Q7NPZ7_9ACTN|nr:MazG family protein [Motilibacter rhizosphaerae]RZS87359.1 XTP/dITP diphosphohydrolase [Motilibacter rhizosphaerae]
MTELVAVLVSRRVAPGLLTAEAWDALRAASAVAFHPSAAPHVPALRAAGLAVEESVDAPGDGAWVVDGEVAAAVPDGSAVVVGAVELPGSRLLDLVALMDRLRSPGGCPWDAEQTHESLVQYLVEETYEVIEAIEQGSATDLREELGDLLLQVVFHARIAEERTEEERFGIDEVATGITDKLVRRHPHVFAGTPSDAHTERGWDAIKRQEKGRASAVDGVPMGQPALALAAKVLGRVDRAGLDVPVQGDDPGDDLLRTVARLRADGVDPEATLRAAVRRYAATVRSAEGASGP